MDQHIRLPLVVRALYLVTFLAVLFLTIYWVVVAVISRQEKREAERVQALRAALMKKQNSARQRKHAT